MFWSRGTLGRLWLSVGSGCYYQVDGPVLILWLIVAFTAISEGSIQPL